MRATLALVAALLLPAMAGAQGIGNPLFSHYDFVLQGTVEYGSIDRDLDSGRQNPESSELTTTLFKAIVGVHPRLDLYLLLGKASLDLCSGDAQDVCGEDGQISASDFAYGGGARWSFWQGKHVEAAVGGQALWFSVNDSSENTDRSVDWTGYQLFTGASFPTVPYATPYLGLRYDIVNATLTGPSSVDLSADSPASAFMGVDIPWGNYLSLSLEGTVGDNTGWALGLNARY